MVVRRGFLSPLQTLQRLLTALRLFRLLPGHIAPDKLFLTPNLHLLQLIGFVLLFEPRGLGRHVRRVVPNIALQTMLLQLHDFVNHTVEKITIM